MTNETDEMKMAIQRVIIDTEQRHENATKERNTLLLILKNNLDKLLETEEEFTMKDYLNKIYDNVESIKKQQSRVDTLYTQKHIVNTLQSYKITEQKLIIKKDSIGKYAQCPRCNTMHRDIHVFQDYCPFCGQPLDRGD